MVTKRYKTYEEKINEFLKEFESSTYNHRFEDFFQSKYTYLEKDEISSLYTKCLEIESFGKQQVEFINQGAITIQTAKDEVKKKYPLIESRRIDRLISRKLYETVR